ncbi:MAG: tRNA pseudouridine synthase A [Akkermansiaceae bacterium]|nr:tRNA pseudouridine synthase A [Akkermansiaceae bacterium]
MRLKLTIAYDGRPFGGWQIQPHADTIQERIETALREVAGEPLRIHGSGRTDAGVHATGQVAHFDAPDQLTMNPVNWLAALNTKLPATIRIMDCEEAAPDFHARFSTTGKCYQYELSTAPILPPRQAGLAWHLPRQLDPATLEEALAFFRGTHDFRAFAANRGNEMNRRTPTTFEPSPRRPSTLFRQATSFPSPATAFSTGWCASSPAWP